MTDLNEKYFTVAQSYIDREESQNKISQCAIALEYSRLEKGLSHGQAEKGIKSIVMVNQDISQITTFLGKELRSIVEGSSGTLEIQFRKAKNSKKIQENFQELFLGICRSNSSIKKVANPELVLNEAGCRALQEILRKNNMSKLDILKEKGSAFLKFMKTFLGVHPSESFPTIFFRLSMGAMCAGIAFYFSGITAALISGWLGTRYVAGELLRNIFGKIEFTIGVKGRKKAWVKKISAPAALSRMFGIDNPYVPTIQELEQQVSKDLSKENICDWQENKCFTQYYLKKIICEGPITTLTLLGDKNIQELNQAIQNNPEYNTVEEKVADYRKRAGMTEK